jgi:hypothetical protein
LSIGAAAKLLPHTCSAIWYRAGAYDLLVGFVGGSNICFSE